MSARLLVVDDEPSMLDMLSLLWRAEGYEVETARSVGEARERLAERPVDLVLCDILMPDGNGLELLREIKASDPRVAVIMMTAYTSTKSALEAMKLGAYDYISKPFADLEELKLLVAKALEKTQLVDENVYLRGELERRYAFDRIVGRSPRMRAVFELVERVARTHSTVLIQGESGTGKELVAREIHRLSPRRDRAFVQVNCAAIPDELIESELFGHEKGSFTGAVRKQVGKFVAADGGTIFLDEIGDMSPRTQAKVLRVLQNGEVEPVGAARVVRVDVRVVAATNRDLPADIEAGRFREDLYFRLNVVPVRTPALREHIEDLPVLVDHFVRRFTELQSYRPRRLDDEALAFLKALPWRGNVRELRNLVERLLILAPGLVIDRAAVVATLGGAQPEIGPALFSLPTLREFRDEAERLYLVRKLEENDWNVSQTAQAIDTPRSNLYKKMEQYAIRRPDEAAADD